MKVKVFFIDDSSYNEWVNDCEWHGEVSQELYWHEIVFDTKRAFNNWLNNDKDYFAINEGLTIKRVLYGKKSFL